MKHIFLLTLIITLSGCNCCVFNSKRVEFVDSKYNNTTDMYACGVYLKRGYDRYDKNMENIVNKRAYAILQTTDYKDCQIVHTGHLYGSPTIAFTLKCDQTKVVPQAPKGD